MTPFMTKPAVVRSAWTVALALAVFAASSFGLLQLSPAAEVAYAQGSLQETLVAAAEQNQVIQLNPNAALQKRIFAQSFVPNSPEFRVQVNTVTYLAQRAENLASGRVRVYYAVFGNWNTVYFAERGVVAPGSFGALMLAQGDQHQVIQFNPNAALQKRIFAAGFVPNSPEFQLQFNSAPYVGQRAESLSTGEVRVYYAGVGDWNNVNYVVRGAAPLPTPTPIPTPTATPLPPTGAFGFGYGIQFKPDNMPSVTQDINTLGLTWGKFQVAWKEYELSPGTRNLAGFEGAVNALRAAHINVLLNIDKAPNWARPTNTDLSVEGPPADPNTYAAFAGAVAKYYCGRVDAIEVWNEQNLYYEWGNEPLSPARYMQLLKAAYPAIKANCPGMLVISGAPTPAGNIGTLAIDDIEYLQGMYANGLANYADAVGAHPSGFNTPPDADWRTYSNPTQVFRGPSDNHHHSWTFSGTMLGYREVMVANGDVSRRIWPTEFGWASSPTPPPGYEYAADNSLDQQAQYIVQAYQLAKGWGFVGPMFLWNLNFNVTNPGTELAMFSIKGRPAFTALAAAPK